MAVTQEDWEQWLELAPTKALREWARRERQELMELWAGGSFSAAFDVEMAVKNAGATGACAIYQFIQELDFSNIVEIENAESIGAGTQGSSGTD